LDSWHPQHFLMSNCWVDWQGWSEPAATNAPVKDEAVEVVLGMNQNHILPAQFFCFFAFILPQNISLLPTYLLPPPSYLPPTSPFLPTSPLLPPISYLRSPLLESAGAKWITITRAGTKRIANVGRISKLQGKPSFSFCLLFFVLL